MRVSKERVILYEMRSRRQFWMLRRMIQQKRSRLEKGVLGISGLAKGTVQSQESTAPAGLRRRSPVILEGRQRTNKC